MNITNKKKILLAILFMSFSNLVFSQEKFIYFELDSTVTSIDTIVIKSNTDLFRRILKVPSKNKIKFYVSLGEKKIKIKLKRKYLDRYNTISFLKDNEASQILIMKGHTHHRFFLDSKNIDSIHWKIQIQSHSKWIDENNELTTESDSFNSAIKDNPEFFFK